MMNSVPRLFYKNVLSGCFDEGSLSDCRDLSGLFGRVASEAYKKWLRLSVCVKNGRVEGETYFDVDHRPVDVERIGGKRLLKYTVIEILADKQEYATDPAALQKIASASRGNLVFLILKTPNISKEIQKCIESIQFIHQVELYTTVTGGVLKILQSLVQKRTLNSLYFAVQLEEQTTQLILELLKQNQLDTIFLYRSCFKTVKAVIESWEENAHAMIGNEVHFGGKPEDLQLTEIGFEECTADEESYIKRFYPVATGGRKIQSVLNHGEGRAVYSFVADHLHLKTSFLFT